MPHRKWQSSKKRSRPKKPKSWFGSHHLFTFSLLGSIGIMTYGLSSTGNMLNGLTRGLIVDVEAHTISQMAKSILAKSCTQSLRGLPYLPDETDPIDGIELKQISAEIINDSAKPKSKNASLRPQTVFSQNKTIGDFTVESIQLVKTGPIKENRHLANIVLNLKKRDTHPFRHFGLQGDTQLTQVFPISVEVGLDSPSEIIRCVGLDENSAVLKPAPPERKPSSSLDGKLQAKSSAKELKEKVEQSKPSKNIISDKMIEIVPIHFEPN